MTQSMDQVHREIMLVADLGVGRNCGRPAPSDINTKFFSNFSFVDADFANDSIESSEFENFLLSVRPERSSFPDVCSAKGFLDVFNDIAVMVKPYVADISSHISISGLDNSPQGFSPSAPSSTVSWILTSYAQEHVAVEDFRYSGPRKCEDLLEILKSGRLPVGFTQGPLREKIFIY